MLGLTLQNSVGQIISGLLLLFEQPFQIGDWVDTPSARGRVVEVNWRATHIDTGSGLQIIPNSVLAGASFTNLSRPPGEHSISVVTEFGPNDPPDDVCGLLLRVAAALPHLRPGAAPTQCGGRRRASTRRRFRLRSPADDGAARATFLRWVWYAARRAGLHLDEVDDDFATAGAAGEVAADPRADAAAQRRRPAGAAPPHAGSPGTAPTRPSSSPARCPSA